MSGAHPEKIVIAQVSDIHCGDPRFDRALLQTCIESVNAARPDLFIVAGDLTATGYRDEYEEAMRYLELFACPRKLIQVQQSFIAGAAAIHLPAAKMG